MLRALLGQCGEWRIYHCDNNSSKGSKGAGREGFSCRIDFKVGANCKGLPGLVKQIVYSCWMVFQKKKEGLSDFNLLIKKEEETIYPNDGQDYNWHGNDRQGHFRSQAQDNYEAEYEEETLKGGCDPSDVTTIGVRKQCKIC